ncbi:MAG: hypothetical protein DRP23_01915, partial [Thermotogae bacterium]
PLAADVTGDGNIEIIRTGEDYLTVLNGTDGSIIWSDYIAGLYSHSPFELADCNKDGIPEIIVGVGHLRVIYGNNGTTYWERTDCNVDGHFPVTGDTDGDGYPEIFTVGNHAINKVSHDGKLLASNWTYYSCFGGLSLAYSTYDDEFYVLQGDRSWNYPEPGSGGEGVKCFWASNLTKKWSHPKVLCSSHCPAVADVDKDGYEDVIALQQSGGGIVVYNLSDGSVIHETYNIPDLECHSQPTIYDIDGDGNLECIACKSSPAIVWDLYAWQKDATLESCGEPPAVGDINGDGKMEIICPSGNIYNGTYDLVGTVPGGSFTAWTLLQDVDGDSSNELIVTRGGSVYCYDTPAPAPTPRARTDKQFYSQSKLRAAEYVPYGSQKPLLSNECPPDGSISLLNPTLSIKVGDLQNDSMTIIFRSNASGDWQDLGTYYGGYGIYSQNTTNMNVHNTTYYWSVNCTDGTHWSNKTYSFTTYAGGPWWDMDWLYRKAVIVDHTMVDADLTNFPILVDITDNDLSEHALSSGDDIVFTDLSGNKLNHEIELYNDSSGHLVAWVNVTNLSSTEDTILYMYYGNPSCGNQENPEGVWDSHYLAVHHLEEVSGTHYDSTSNDNDGTPYGSIDQNVTGRINGADYFDGSDDHVILPQVYSSETQFTMEAWIYAETGARYFVSQWNNNKGAFIQVGAGGTNMEWYIDGTSAGSTSINLDRWYYVVGTYNGSTAKLYKNAGTPVTKAHTAPNWPSEGTYIGDRSAGSRQFHGIIDEVRFSDIARNASWIITSYNNQNDPDSFYDIGNEENVHAPRVLDENPADGAVDVSDTITELNFTLIDFDGDSMNYTVVTIPDIGSGNGSGHNGTYFISVSNLDIDTTYIWCVNVTDGTYWTNKTFSFTTGVTLDPFQRGWNYRKPLTINHTLVASNLTDFPLLVDITDDDLRAHAQPDGDDILFMDGPGVADRLYHEVETYDESSGHLVAWVKIPTLSATNDTTIYLYYGNSNVSSYEKPYAVWDSDFEAVWHLDETAGGVNAWKDSTGNGYDGTDENMVPSSFGVPGKIGDAVHFDGTNDFINTNLYPDVSKKTLEFWVNFDRVSGDQAIGCHDGSHRFYAGVKTDVFDRFYYGMGNAYKLGSDLGGISVGEWAYIALTGDSSTAHLYINGVEKDNTSYSYIGTSTDTFHIGSRTLNGPASMFVDGVIDEVRVSYTNRSAAWISTCYNNQNDPVSFVSIGHEAFNSKAPYLTDPSPVDGALFENLNPTLSIYASDLQGDQMSIIFMTNESGSWQPIGSTHNGYNDTYTQSTTVFDEYDTRYWWSVNCTDGIYWSNKTFSFTTEPDLPILSDESPPDGGYGTLNPQLSVNIVDYQGDQLTVEFWTNASGAWHLLGSYTGGNGTYTETGADMDTLGSTYYWSVNVTDAGSGKWVNRTYGFTTRLLALKWKVPTSGTVIGPLAADLTNDTGLEIVVTGDDGCVYCLNGTDGSVIWRYCTGGIGLHSPFEIADLNKDGYKEVIIAAGDALVLHGNNGTVYWRNTSVATDGHYPVVQDINGSGYPTVFFCSDDINHGWNGTGRITSMTYDGRVLNQTFAWHPCYGGLSIADCDFDGEYELFMSDRAFNYTEDGVPDGGCGRGMRCFYAQNLTPRWNISNITCSSHCIVLADANNDGVLDAIACDQSCDTDKTGGLAVINVSDGTIIHKKINMNLPSHSNPTVYDIDGDGNLEIIMCQGSPPKIWDLYDWKLDATLPVVCGEPPKLGDVTGDGSMDIIASSGNKITVYVYDNGSYTQVEEVTGLNGARAFTIVQDVDDDGLNEIIVPSSKYVYCFDTPAKAATPLYDTTSQEYGGRRTGAPEPQTPDLRAELPRDKSILQPLNPELSILAFDYQYELINISFMTNASGHWNEIQSYVDASSGKFTAIPTDMVEYETTYFWSVNATDSGTGQWVNKTFRFTTAPLAPVVSDPFPTDGSTDVPVTLSKLWFNLTDYQNDNMSYTVGTSPDIGFENRNNVSSGRYNLTVNNLQYCTLYTWYVNVTDGTHWNNVTFSFITELPTVSNPFDNGWTYQRSITINHTLVAANLTGFPLLISIDTDNNLSAHAQPDGDDILFMDGPGVATRLPHEIEVYNSSSGHLVAWVNVSNLSSTEDTVIYMYYGNVAAVNMEDPFNVWDSDFEAVWHLDETAGGVNAWKDSTDNGYDGTDENMNQTDPNTD